MSKRQLNTHKESAVSILRSASVAAVSGLLAAGAALAPGTGVANAEPSLHDEQLLQTAACANLAMGNDPDTLVKFLQMKMPQFSHSEVKGTVRFALASGCAG